MNSQQINTLKPESCVYFVQDMQSGIIKIGKTGNFVQRFRSLQNSGANDLGVFDKIKTKNPSETEKIMHDFFKSERLHGEWFALTAFEDRIWIDFMALSANYFEGGFDGFFE